MRRDPLDVWLFDTTLRDGTQSEGLSLSVEDKLRIAGLLDAFGIHYIEGGWPASNPKDSEFFRARPAADPAAGAARGVRQHAQGRRARPESDANLRALLEAETPAVAIFGKSSTLHVERVLETTLDENLAMIADSVAWLKKHGREVVYDAEHFFDGYRRRSRVRAAHAAGGGGRRARTGSCSATRTGAACPRA